VAHLVERRGAYRVVVRKLGGKSPLGRSRRKWKDSVKISLKEIRWEGVDWSDSAQDTERWRAVVKAVMKRQSPQNAGTLLTC
jgi:hypothetical protein